MTFTELTARYVELTRQRPDRRWKESTLAAKVAEVEADLAEQARLTAEKEAAKEAARIERETRIEARGPFDEFAAASNRFKDLEEGRLVRVCVWAKSVIDQRELFAAEFAKAFADNPQYAMSWSGKYFQHASELQVAVTVRDYFENGITEAGMLDAARSAMMQKAKYPARSTSPTSNLTEQEELVAWTKVVGYMDGSEYF